MSCKKNMSALSTSALQGFKLIWVTAFLSIFSCSLVYYYNGVSEETIRLCIRLTARVSFFLFFLTFTASSLIVISKNIFFKSLLQNRRYVGLSFGTSHIIHLFNILILLFVVYHGDINGLGGLKKLAPSIAVYLLIFVMMATSNDYAVKQIGFKAWAWLHKLGMYFIAIALAVGFYKVVNKNRMLYEIFLAIMFLGLALRIYAWLIMKKRKSKIIHIELN